MYSWLCEDQWVSHPLSCALGRSASVEMILEKSGFTSVAVIDGYHLPHPVSWIVHEFISSDCFFHSQWELKFSSWLLTTCMSWLLFHFLGILGKWCTLLRDYMILLLKSVSTFKQNCVSGVVDILPNPRNSWDKLVFLFFWLTVSNPLETADMTLFISNLSNVFTA